MYITKNTISVSVQLRQLMISFYAIIFAIILVYWAKLLWMPATKATKKKKLYQNTQNCWSSVSFFTLRFIFVVDVFVVVFLMFDSCQRPRFQIAVYLQYLSKLDTFICCFFLSVSSLSWLLLPFLNRNDFWFVCLLFVLKSHQICIDISAISTSLTHI